VAEKWSGEAVSARTMLSANDVFGGLQAIAQTSGKGAIEHKSAQLIDLLTRVDSVSAKYAVRIVLGNLRLGSGDATVVQNLLHTVGLE